MIQTAQKTLLRALAAAGLIAGAAALLAPQGDSHAQSGKAPDLAPLPEAKFDKRRAELGRYLFFDARLSGDAAISCATCHKPENGWADGQPLSKAYPGSEYFRNAPTVVNAVFRDRFMWDGRLDGTDLGTLVRDKVTEGHFMQSDGRIIQQRLKQVPEYVAMWTEIFGKGSDPYGPAMFGIVGDFVRTLTSRNAPIDRFLKGDQGAIGAEAKEGHVLYKGKAGCIACHNGPLASDGRFHRTGVPENPEVWNDPLRAITMLRHYSTQGMPNYMNARTDVGLYAITKDDRHRGMFLTPSLRELKYTAPYMHNGVFATLAEVVDFYDKGGGKGSVLKGLGLTAAEKKALVAFLETMSGEPVKVDVPKSPPYKPRNLGKN
ncbi:MAG: photosynthetic protein synthase I [Betaproteobacteria bacterium]|nr:photosynthetic protein synthase I [Betaproteobacteria bacterium]